MYNDTKELQVSSGFSDQIIKMKTVTFREEPVEGKIHLQRFQSNEDDDGLLPKRLAPKRIQSTKYENIKRERVDSDSSQDQSTPEGLFKMKAYPQTQGVTTVRTKRENEHYEMISNVQVSHFLMTPIISCDETSLSSDSSNFNSESLPTTLSQHNMLSGASEFKMGGGQANDMNDISCLASLVTQSDLCINSIQLPQSFAVDTTESDNAHF